MESINFSGRNRDTWTAVWDAFSSLVKNRDTSLEPQWNQSTFGTLGRFFTSFVRNWDTFLEPTNAQKCPKWTRTQLGHLNDNLGRIIESRTKLGHFFGAPKWNQSCWRRNWDAGTTIWDAFSKLGHGTGAYGDPRASRLTVFLFGTGIGSVRPESVGGPLIFGTLLSRPRGGGWIWDTPGGPSSGLDGPRRSRRRISCPGRGRSIAAGHRRRRRRRRASQNRPRRPCPKNGFHSAFHHGRSLVGRRLKLGRPTSDECPNERAVPISHRRISVPNNGRRQSGTDPMGRCRVSLIFFRGGRVIRQTARPSDAGGTVASQSDLGRGDWPLAVGRGQSASCKYPRRRSAFKRRQPPALRFAPFPTNRLRFSTVVSHDGSGFYRFLLFFPFFCFYRVFLGCT